MPRWIWLLVTFHFVTWVWVPFRAGAAPDTVATMLRVAFGPFTAPLGDWSRVLSENLWLLLVFAIFIAMHRWDDHRAVRRAVRRLPAPVLWPLLGLVWALAITVSQGSSKKFVYFDF